MNKLKNLLFLFFFLIAISARSQVLFYDDFESGSLSNWNVRGASAMVISPSGTNRVPENGLYSMQLTNSANAMYALLRQVTTNQSGETMTNTVSVTSNSFKFSVWINDASATATRVFAQMMTHTDGQYAGNIEQVFGIGKYNQTDVTNHITGETEGYNGNKYQGRMSFGMVSGWFNLDAPGSPNRSLGWHLFEIEVGTNTVVHSDPDFGSYPEYVANFYVDGILSKSYTNVYVGEPIIPNKWDSIVVGLGAGSTIGNAFYDGFRVVQGQPFFATHPEPQSLKVGETISLSASVGGSSGVTYQWQKDGTNLPNATAASLTINNAQLSDSGSYRLVASNSLDDAASFAAAVTVNPLIMITVPPVSQRVNSGDTLTLTVAATGSGTLQYQWKKDGEPLPGETSDILTINSATADAAGSYTVVVSNGVDPSAESAPAIVQINSAPDFVDNFPIQAAVNEVLTFPVPVQDDFSVAATPLFDFENVFGTNTIMFRAPNFSGSTGAQLEPGAEQFSQTSTNVPPVHGGTNALHVRWSFIPTATWLRLTTFNTATYPNPTISVVDPLRFDVYTDKDVLLAIGVRETGTTNALGSNGTTTSGIEFVGSTNASTPKPVRLISSNTWTTVEFDFQDDPIRNFAGGNGVLDTSTGKGVLEHLAFARPADSTGGEFNVYLDNFTVVPKDPLRFTLGDAPAGAVIDSATGVITWRPDVEGTFDFQIIVTDSGGLSAATTQQVQVRAGGNPGPLTISRNGSEITVSWEGPGTLQATSDLSLAFENVASESPHRTEVVPGGAMFYRLTR